MIIPQKKIKSLTFIVIVLLAINIAMIIFFINNKPAEQNPPEKNQSIVATFLQNDIGFDEHQMELYKKVKESDFEKGRSIFHELRNAKNNFYENIYRKDVADSILEKSAAMIGKKQEAVDMQMLKHFRNVRSICTEQQLPKFDSLFKNVIEKITAGRFRRHTDSR
jgi:hypothetical protein